MHAQAALPSGKPAYSLFHSKLHRVKKSQCVQAPVEGIKRFIMSKWSLLASNWRNYNTGVTSVPLEFIIFDFSPQQMHKWPNSDRAMDLDILALTESLMTL